MQSSENSKTRFFFLKNLNATIQVFAHIWVFIEGLVIKYSHITQRRKEERCHSYRTDFVFLMILIPSGIMIFLQTAL